MDVKEILSDLGYKGLKNYNRDFRYGDKGHLTIDKRNGNWYNYKTNSGGPISHLVKETLGVSSSDAKKWLKQRHNYEYVHQERIEIHDTLNCPETFDNELLTKLCKNHDYWVKRGVSSDTVSFFEGGTVQSGKLANRYVFPIFNSRKQITGFTGRSLKDHPIKWFHRGKTSEWVYPAFFNLKYIQKEKSVIFVEGIGDMLKLWECGVRNTLVNFGLNISNSVLNFLFKVRPQKIYLAFDNDESGAGEKAANKAKEKLVKHFDYEKIIMKLASGKDFGEMTTKQINQWKNEL